jgi:adenylate cyclase class IV
MIEVELKFEIPPQSRALLQARLDDLPGIRWLGQITNSDSYLDTASLDCLRQAVFIRIRNRKQLEMKFHDHADPAHTHSTERAFPIEPGSCLMSEINTLCSRFIPAWHAAATVEQAIHLNDLIEYAHIANKRTLYTFGTITLSIDEVEGLGTFLEIETPCAEEAQVERSLARLHAFVSELALPILQPVQTGYVEQWLQRYRPQLSSLTKEPV